MKRLVALALLLSVSAAACTKDDDSTTPVGPSNTVTLVAQMSGTQNVPPAGTLEAGAVGTAQIVMTPGSNGYTATVTLQLGGLVRAGLLPAPLDSGSVIVAGLIHAGGPGTVGAPVAQLPISLAAPLVSPTGSILIQLTNVQVAQAAGSAIAASPSSFYLNLYSALNQTGVLRGQLVKQ